MNKILIIDDEIEMLNSLQKILARREDLDLELIQNGSSALQVVKEQKFDVIITDLMMKDVSGMDILKACLNRFPDSVVIIISGYGTIDASVEAMRQGAFDFIEKPFTSRRLFESIDRALAQRTAGGPSGEIPAEVDEALKGIIYRSPQMAELIAFMHKIAVGNMNVLITGESGTGKELIARAIHNLSKRRHSPFVPVNCGALPEHLFESELFGYERGAFTGAVKTKPGLLEFADQGTFFLDEIGELSTAMQVKLLRMLEDKKIRRLGSEKEISIDVRIIAATNRDLESAVSEKKFRADLFYRLNTIHIDIPPLRKRKEDILPLAEHILKDLNAKNDKGIKGFTPDARQAMLDYPWSGNVRELQNMIGRAYILCVQSYIDRTDFPLSGEDRPIAIDREMLELSYKEAKELVMEQFEMEYLTHHLKKNEGNISKTADECGLDRRSIHRLINKYHIVYQK